MYETWICLYFYIPLLSTLLKGVECICGFHKGYLGNTFCKRSAGFSTWKLLELIINIETTYSRKWQVLQPTYMQEQY